MISSVKPLTTWVILKWSLLRRCWSLIYKQLLLEIFICGIYWATHAFPLYVWIFVNESPTIVRTWIKAIGKESSSVRIHSVHCQNFCLWVFILHRRMKKGNDEIICIERLSSITFEKKLTKNVETKPVFFLKKKQLSKKNSQRLKWKHFAS